METTRQRLQTIRNEAVGIIRDFVQKTPEKAVYFTELDSSPMVTPSQSLDSVEMLKKGNSDELFFSASGETDNGLYLLEDVSTDLLVNVMEIIEREGKSLLGEGE